MLNINVGVIPLIIGVILLWNVFLYVIIKQSVRKDMMDNISILMEKVNVKADEALSSWATEHSNEILTKIAELLKADMETLQTVTENQINEAIAKIRDEFTNDLVSDFETLTHKIKNIEEINDKRYSWLLETKTTKRKYLNQNMDLD